MTLDAYHDHVERALNLDFLLNGGDKAQKSLAQSKARRDDWYFKLAGFTLTK